MQTTNSKIAKVVIIGRDDSHTFRDLLQMFRRSDGMHVSAEYQTLSAALKAGLGQTMSADFVIVLQSCSYEFGQHEINELIGRLLFGRILCCYGPWCTADGRSHELWPVASRIPAASAASLIELELACFRANIQPLFPMSASEEVFAYRSQFMDVFEPAVRSKAIVISDDSELRTIVGRILAVLNCESTALPPFCSAIRSHLASRSDDIEFAIIDLDTANGDVQECLDVLHSEGRITTVAGMTVFAASLANPATQSTRQPLHFIEKTELLLQLRKLLKSVLSCPQIPLDSRPAAFRAVVAPVAEAAAGLVVQQPALLSSTPAGVPQ